MASSSLQRYSTQVEKSDAFSEEDIGFEKAFLRLKELLSCLSEAWLGVQSKVQPAFRRPLEEVTATESCCWICENWVEQEVHYIPGPFCSAWRKQSPGWSGPLEEVTKVFAYFSIDGFTRPLRFNSHHHYYHIYRNCFIDRYMIYIYIILMQYIKLL